MKFKELILLQKFPAYLFLLPVFFVLHGFTENYDYIPVSDSFLLAAVYILSATVILLLTRLIFKSWTKAGLFVFVLFVFHFFFGSMQDALRNIFGDTFLSRYIFILPAALLIFILLFAWLKRRKKPLAQVTRYLNLLLLLLLLIDTGWLVIKIISRDKPLVPLPGQLTICKNCPKPDLYLIITDEYAGQRQLKDLFSFDNSPFYKELSDRGFQVVTNSSSNYNLTPYSIASILNLDYLDKDEQSMLTNTYRSVGSSTLLRFLKEYGYEFYNYSYFDFPGQPSYARETFLPLKTKLITQQTFLSRVEKEMRFHLTTTLRSKKEIRKNAYYSRDNNEKLSRMTIEIAKSKKEKPKFVFTHLMMPHYPYYYDRNGQEFSFESLAEGKQNNQHHYLEYLQYSNKKILEIMDLIIQNSSHPPIILLLGDHGFRHFDKPVNSHYIFSNLAAIHLPGNEHLSINDSSTNINIMRAVLNGGFDQKLPYLKDSSILIDNP
jgi:hypothetical protein